MTIPDTKDVIQIIYKYKYPDKKEEEYYVEGADVKKYLSQVSSASIMSVIHGATFEPLGWKKRKTNV